MDVKPPEIPGYNFRRQDIGYLQDTVEDRFRLTLSWRAKGLEVDIEFYTLPKKLLPPGAKQVKVPFDRLLVRGLVTQIEGEPTPTDVAAACDKLVARARTEFPEERICQHPSTWPTGKPQ